MSTETPMRTCVECEKCQTVETYVRCRECDELIGAADQSDLLTAQAVNKLFYEDNMCRKCTYGFECDGHPLCEECDGKYTFPNTRSKL